MAEPEINPYPGASIVPQTVITVTGTDKHGKPLDGVDVEVKTCTAPGSSSGDGHLHDKRESPCSTGDRPATNLEWEFLHGNPITVILRKGTAESTTIFHQKVLIRHLHITFLASITYMQL